MSASQGMIVRRWEASRHVRALTSNCRASQRALVELGDRGAASIGAMPALPAPPCRPGSVAQDATSSGLGGCRARLQRRAAGGRRGARVAAISSGGHVRGVQRRRRRRCRSARRASRCARARCPARCRACRCQRGALRADEAAVEHDRGVVARARPRRASARRSRRRSPPRRRTRRSRRPASSPARARSTSGGQQRVEVALVVATPRARRGSRRAPRARTAASARPRAARPSARRSGRRPGRAARPAGRSGSCRRRAGSGLVVERRLAARRRAPGRTPTRPRAEVRRVAVAGRDARDAEELEELREQLVAGAEDRHGPWYAFCPGPVGPSLHERAQCYRGTAGRRRGRRRAGLRATGRGRSPLARRLGSTARPPRGPRRPCCRSSSPACTRCAAEEERPALACWSRTTRPRASWPRRVAPYRPGVPVGYFPGRGVEWGSGLEPRAARRRRARAGARRCSPRGGIVASRPPPLAERLRAARPPPGAVAVRRGDQLERDDLVAAPRRRRLRARARHGRGARPAVGARRRRRRLPVHRPRAAALRALRRRDRARQRLLRAHAALAARPRRGARAPRARGAPAPGPRPCTTTTTARRTCPRASCRWRRSCTRPAWSCAWQPARVAGGDARAAGGDAPAGAAARPRLPARARTRSTPSSARTRSTRMPQGQPVTFEGQAPALAARGVAEAENELRGWCGAASRPRRLPAPRRGRAHRAAAAARRGASARRRRARCPTRPGVAFVVSRAAPRLRVRRPLGIAVLPSHAALPPRRRAHRPPRRPRASRSFTDLRPERLRGARGPRRRRASRASTRRPSPASRATTWSWSSRARTASSCRTSSSGS